MNRCAPLAALLATALSVAAADPEGRNNLADRHELPSGNGLAAAYPGDVGLKSNPQVIFADDFETGTLGDGWDDQRNDKGKVLQFAASDARAGLGKRCLRVEAHLG